MSESPPAAEEKELNTYTVPKTADVESGDNGIVVKANPLARELKGRHMQMIAIGMLLCVFSLPAWMTTDHVQLLGGAIGAGLFVGSGSALSSGGPGSLVCNHSPLLSS
jgi:amino acid transporter